MALIGSLINATANQQVAKINAQAQKEAAQIQADAQKEASELSYAAVLQQIAAQKEANAQQQAYNKEEAELAFQRNSSLGQLQQLMAAGLSEQQARQIIAGGSAGSYTAAPSVNQMQGVDYTAAAAAKGQGIIAQGNADATATLAQAQVDTQAIQSQADIYQQLMISQVLDWFSDAPEKLLDGALNLSLNQIGTSLSAPDGGLVGNLSTASLQGQVLRHINELPPEARGSYAAFCSYANSSAAPAWMKTADFKAAMQSATSSPMAMKSMRNFFETDNQLLTGDTYWKQIVADTKMKEAGAKISSFKVDQEQVATDLAVIENEYKIAILPERYGAMLTQWQSDIAEMATKRDLWENEEYKKQYLASKLADAESAAILAKVMTLKHQGQFDYLNQKPEMKQLFAIYQMFADAGMTDSMFGEVVASIEAYGQTSLGYGVSDILTSVKEWIDTRKEKKGIL